MDGIHITETKIGATNYTVERVFSGGSKETAFDAIKRLLLQSARREGREKISESYRNPLDLREKQS